MKVLTAKDVASISSMRARLTVIQKQISDAGRRGEMKTARAPEHTAMSVGRLVEALDAAETALFNVLNIASSYLDDENADRALKNYNESRAA